MLYTIKNYDDLKQLDKIASLQNQVKEIRLQNKLGKQKIHENYKKVFEPVTETIENTSEILTKTMMLTFKHNSKALSNVNDKLLELMKDNGLLASYLLSPLPEINNLDHNSQYKPKKILTQTGLTIC